MNRRLPKPFSREELEALDRATVRPDVLAVMTFLGETGLRSAEALSITRAEAAAWPSPGRIRGRHPRAVTRIIGKGPGSMHSEDGGKERAIVLSRAALLASRVLLGHPSTNGRGEFLVPWSERGLRYVLQVVGQRAGVHCHPHRFRHSWVTQLVEAGNPIEVVADMAGHESIDTTRLYFLLSERSKVEAMGRRRRWLRRNF